MPTTFTLAKSFVATLRTPASIAGLLSDDATFATFNARLSGRDAVAARFAGASPPYAEMTWSEPEAFGDAAKLTGVPGPASAHNGVILLVHANGDRIVSLQEQNRPPKPPAATALRLPPDLKGLIDNALATKHPMTFAYVSEAGQPVLSFRGSTQVYSDDQLAVWIRNQDGDLLRSIAGNPHVALMYRDEESRATYAFRGRAHVSSDDAVRKAVYDKSAPAERAHDWAQTGAAVIIDLDRVDGWAGMGPSGQIGRLNMARGG
jgi:hypothetical protein